MKRVLSLFDRSGNWSMPWARYGYSVETLDISRPPELQEGRIHYECDILEFDYTKMATDRYDAVLAAVPCTSFALSGARWFKDKDTDGRTEASLALALRSLQIIQYFTPRVWAVENPMSRIHKLLPQLGSPRMKFHPYEYGDYSVEKEDYYKMTWLWGDFQIPPKRAVVPEKRDKNGHGKIGNLWLKPRKEWADLRSITPMGFAIAFAQTNALKD